MQKDIVEVLQSFPLFKGIDYDDLNRLMKCFPPQMYSYAKKETVINGGSPFNGMGIVVSGEVAIIKETPSGNRIIVAFLRPGEIFGDLMLSSNIRYWTVSTVANIHSQVVFLRSDNILTRCRNLCVGHSTFIMNLFGIISHKALVFNKRLEHLAARHLRGKVSSYLMEHYQLNGTTVFDIPLKRHELADYFNVSRPSLSREMKLLKEEGIIDYERSKITVKNISALENSLE